MTTNHPITPPPELVQEWCQQGRNCGSELDALKDLAIQAARWGADQELEACCEWVRTTLFIDLDGHDALRTARRPKPPSLKEQAFAALQNSHVDPVDETLQLSADAELIIRRALETLDD